MESLKKKNLSEDQVNELIGDLLDRSSIENGERVLARGAVSAAAKKFKMTEHNVRRIWRKTLTNRQTNGSYHYTSLKKANSGRPPVYDRKGLQEALAELPSHERGTIRDMSRQLGVSIGLCHTLVRTEKVILPHSSAIKPFLTEHNKVQCWLYALERIHHGKHGQLMWYHGFEEIHVDEKWFFLSAENFRYYVTPKEKKDKAISARRCKHKSHIIKVMFLCAVARPRFDDSGTCIFDGKLGIWPFVQKVQAQRTSSNRPRGTWETKPVTVTKDVYREYIIGKLLPAIYEKFSRDCSRQQNVFLHQDNPNTHIRETDPEWQEAARNHPRFKISMKQQPFKLPDTNILDLGFFRSLQSLQWKQPPARTIDDLVQNVQNAFAVYDPRVLEKIWLTHQGICDNILIHHGDNNFDPPHIGKDAILSNDGKLPSRLFLSENARAALSNAEQV